ncbi:MAG: ribokinase [Dehalococcoidia bacterium]|nr:ribokinase [Dehalococcoidia bacterium]
MSRSVVVLGGLNMDLVVVSPRFPRPGETVEGTHFSTTPGGKGGNQAVAAARQLETSSRVHMIGRVGDDDYGRELCRLLEADGIDTSGVMTDPEAHTGVAVIATRRLRQNTVTAVDGANSNLGDAELQALDRALDGAGVLLVQQETPLDVTKEAMRRARAANVTTVLDPAPAREHERGFLRLVDIITPNQTEAEALSGIEVTGPDTARDAANAIRRLGPRTVIVTLGDQGCVAVGNGYSGSIPALQVDVVSSLAAGDAFNGGLAASLAEGDELERAIRRGRAVASLCVQREGAQSAMPNRAEALALL